MNIIFPICQQKLEGKIRVLEEVNENIIFKLCEKIYVLGKVYEN